MDMAARLVIWPGLFEETFVPLSHGDSIWNLASIGPVVSEKRMFKECGRRTDRRRTDGQTTDDGQRRPTYPISSPMSLRLRWAKKTNFVVKADSLKRAELLENLKHDMKIGIAYGRASPSNFMPSFRVYAYIIHYIIWRYCYSVANVMSLISYDCTLHNVTMPSLTMIFSIEIMLILKEIIYHLKQSYHKQKSYPLPNPLSNPTPYPTQPYPLP